MQAQKETWFFDFLDDGRLNPIISFHIQRAVENFAKNSHPRVIMEWYDCRSGKTEYTHLHKNKYLHSSTNYLSNVLEGQKSRAFGFIPNHNFTDNRSTDDTTERGNKRIFAF